MTILRPANEDELQMREAIGVIRASRFVRKYARSHKLINVVTVCEIHQEIFGDAWPEIAGKFRDVNLEISDSDHHPPLYSKVPYSMEAMNFELGEKMTALMNAEGIIQGVHRDPDLVISMIDRVIRAAAWLHHAITFVHPFREGNGRTARLAANLILERSGLIGISVKMEKENKNRYRQALAQIDKKQDYEPLVEMMYEGLLERYDGVPIKFYTSRKHRA